MRSLKKSMVCFNLTEELFRGEASCMRRGVRTKLVRVRLKRIWGFCLVQYITTLKEAENPEKSPYPTGKEGKQHRMIS